MDDNRKTMELHPDEIIKENKSTTIEGPGFLMADPEPAAEKGPISELHADPDPASASEFRKQFEEFKDTVPAYETANEPPVDFVESYESEKKKKKGFHISGGKLALFIAGIVALSALCGFGGSAVSANLLDGITGDDNTPSATNGYSPEQATGSSLTVSQIAEKASPSVVEIRTEGLTTDSWMQQYVTEGAGSGVIIDADHGYIITNNHVVSDARKVTVKLKNGNEYDADVIGVDSVNDVAVIQIQSKEKLTAAVYDDSDKLVVGELAVAIGNPLGELGGTVTAGIISARDRKINIEGNNMSLLQTDAAINPGNSGGGLFNQYGKLIGLVVAKSSGSDVEGLGFAIPINTASEVADKIIDKGGNISSKNTGDAKIGVTILSVEDEETAMQYGVEQLGVYITQLSHQNAVDAGFQIGDRIVKADGKTIKVSNDLMEVLQEHAPGDKIKVSVDRGGEKVSITTTLASSSEITEMP